MLDDGPVTQFTSNSPPYEHILSSQMVFPPQIIFEFRRYRFGGVDALSKDNYPLQHPVYPD